MRFNYQLLILFVILCQSCAVEEDKTSTYKQNNNQYSATILPTDTTLLWLETGNQLSDTILIVGEGGPKNYLNFEANGRVYWEYLPDHQNYHFAIVHQSSTYNKAIFGATNFTVNDAIQEVDNTSEILYRTIKYFKDRNKHVVVFGHSYSAFVIQHYLSTRPSLANKYIITGGRLDADSLQTAYQLKGINTEFEEDGVTLVKPNENIELNPFRTERFYTIRKNKEMLKYAIGKLKYTSELVEIDLSNVIYYYGMYDGNIGALTSKEIDFMKSKNAKVVGVETGHYDIWKKVVDGFSDGRLSFK